jgi:hypothetical protein
MNRSGHTIAAVLTLVLVACASVAAAEPKPQVVVSLSHTNPDTAYWRRHARWLERRPFDGVGIEIDPRDATWLTGDHWKKQIAWARSKKLDYLAEMYERPRDVGSLSWGGGAGLTGDARTAPWNPGSLYDEQTIAPAIADLSATPPRRFGFNMIVATIMGPTTDWFDDEQWERRCRNFALLARLARAGGCRGIMFDDEQYGEGCAWDYAKLRRRSAVHGHDFDTLRTQARRRGRQFARALVDEFPSIVFWALNGYSSIAWRLDRGQTEHGLHLAPAFFDGMLEGGGDEMVFVDGCAVAYTFNTRAHFEHGRRLITEVPIRTGLTQAPDLYRRKVRVGFGLWPDHRGQIDPRHPERSYFNPARFQRALYWALEVGDGYVWLWGERWSWWLEGPDDRGPVVLHQGRRGLPHAYWEALEAGRREPGADESVMESRYTSGRPFHGRYRCIEGESLVDLLAKTEKVHEFPIQGWGFRLDDWGDYKHEASAFRPIRIGSPWREQGFTGPDKIGWYRIEHRVPEALRQRELYLHVPRARGSVWLGVNGWATAWRHIGFDAGRDDGPFALHNLPQHIVEEGRMTIVLKVEAHDEGAGILAPIHLRAGPP